MRNLYRISIVLGIITILLSIANLIFFFGITHRWFNLTTGVMAALVGPFAIISGLYLRAILRELA